MANSETVLVVSKLSKYTTKSVFVMGNQKAGIVHGRCLDSAIISPVQRRRADTGTHWLSCDENPPRDRPPPPLDPFRRVIVSLFGWDLDGVSQTVGL